MGKYRRYGTKNGIKNVLLSWIQRRCLKCGKFLSKEKIMYCKECYNKIHNKYLKEYEETEKHKEVHKKYQLLHLKELKEYNKWYNQNIRKFKGVM